MIYNFLKTKLLSWQQIESFDFFVSTNLRKIFLASRKIAFSNSVNFCFSNLKIGSPSLINQELDIPITPSVCRRNGSTYSCEVYFNILTREGANLKLLRNFALFRIPVMVKSKSCSSFQKNELSNIKFNECTIDQGGYFVIKGNEKVITIQDQISKNKIFIEPDNSKNITATVYSCHLEQKLVSNITLKGNIFFFRNNNFIEDIPLMVLFKALGIMKEEEIIQIFGNDYINILNPSFFNCKGTTGITQSQAKYYLLERIAVTKKKPIVNINLEKILKSGLFPHIVNEKNGMSIKTQIILFLSLMVKKLLISLKGIPSGLSKDSYENKRIELNGDLITVLIKSLKSRVEKDILKHSAILARRFKNSTYVSNSLVNKFQTLSQDIEQAFSTGNWDLKKFKISPAGSSQMVPRLSFVSMLAFSKKMISQADKLGRDVAPRSLQSTQMGFVCPFDTPEGESCGLIRNLALASQVSFYEPFSLILEICRDLGVLGTVKSRQTSKLGPDSVEIFLNNTFVGIHYDPSYFVYSFRMFRRSGLIGKTVSICWESELGIININSDSGRLLKPLVVVMFGKKKLTQKINFKLGTKLDYFQRCAKEGIIEVLDNSEIRNCLISSDCKSICLETTHCEISLDLGLGTVSSMIPFPEHNQSPRNTYQCSMGKQAIGAIAYNQHLRLDTILNLLVYPQKPLVKTKTINLCGSDRLPSGINVCISIMSFSGFDVEDAIIMNRTSLQRGLFKSMCYRKHSIPIFPIDKTISRGDSVLFKKSKITSIFPEMKTFQMVEISPGNSVNDLIYSFGKIPNSEIDLRQSIFHYGCIDKIQIGKIDNGQYFSKLILRQSRSVETGDKFSSRHGQKGVCGMIYHSIDLPFTTNGTIPDLIMNPHGFPSRMTMGKILELICSKIGSFEGKFKDGSFFSEPKNNFKKGLKNNQIFQEHGKELIFNGITGEMIESRVSNGLVYYQKLKHMVQDKIHSRSRGSRSLLTRQPIEGRARKGGLRVGEMERDCMVSFGVTELIIERLLVSSDYYSIPVDMKTGIIAKDDKEKYKAKLSLPYSCKLLFQELQSMNILPKLFFDEPV